MDFELTRHIIRFAWTDTVRFEEELFRLRLERAKKVREEYGFEQLLDNPGEAFFRVTGGDDPYWVFLDLREGGHYCSCPDGARRVMLERHGSSLCKHVISLLLDEAWAYLLAPYLCADEPVPDATWVRFQSFAPVTLYIPKGRTI